MEVQNLSLDELQKLKRNLECDIAWTEHDLSAMGDSSSLGEEIDLLLDNLQIYKNLYKQVIKKLK